MSYTLSCSTNLTTFKLTQVPINQQGVQTVLQSPTSVAMVTSQNSIDSVVSSIQSPTAQPQPGQPNQVPPQQQQQQQYQVQPQVSPAMMSQYLNGQQVRLDQVINRGCVDMGNHTTRVVCGLIDIVVVLLISTSWSVRVRSQVAPVLCI